MFLFLFFFQLCDGLSILPKKFKYPLNLDISRTKGKFQFLPPSGVRVVGSYLLGTTIKRLLNVDIALSIPVVSDEDSV